MTVPHRLETDELPRVLRDRIVGWFEIRAEDRVDTSARRGAFIALLVAGITIVLAIAMHG
jgi:hypothetical protein